MFIGQMLPGPFAVRTAKAEPIDAPARPEPLAPLRPDELAARAQKSSLNSAFDHLLTPETLASLLALNEDGTIKMDAEGNPQMKNPGSASEDDWFKFGLARAEIKPAQCRTGMTANDEAFFNHMTGCTRVEMGGGLFTIVGADGKPEPLESPAWQVGLLIPAHREAGYLQGEITADWFMPWMDQFMGQGLLPKEWQDRARSWFGKT